MKFFYVDTLFRNQEKLNQIVLENIEPRTTIYTDEWSGYNNLNNIGF